MDGGLMADENGWPEMKRLIEFRLNSIDEKLDRASCDRAAMRSEVSTLRSEVKVMKSKGGAWGAVSGFLAGLGAYLGSRFIG